MDDFIYSIFNGYNIYINDWYSDNYGDKTIITVNEYMWQENNHSDDEVENMNHYYQFDIWGKNGDEVNKVTKEVYRILKNNNFYFQDGQTLNEDNIYRKGLRVVYKEKLI